MPAIDPVTGVPILGTQSPEERLRDYLTTLQTEKALIVDGVHDWVVSMVYAITNDDAMRAAEAQETGTPANPPITLTVQSMLANSGPVCRKCSMPYGAVAAQPCPNMTFEEYMASLPEDVREAVLAKLAEQDSDEPFTVEADGTVRTITTDGGVELTITEDTLPFPRQESVE